VTGGHISAFQIRSNGRNGIAIVLLRESTGWGGASTRVPPPAPLRPPRVAPPTVPTMPPSHGRRPLLLPAPPLLGFDTTDK
jgi:hypothetical protein